MITLKNNKQGFFQTLKKYKNAYIFTGGYLIVFFIFTVLPVIASIGLSFTSFNMVSIPKFIGIENFSTLFLNDNLFITSLKNTIFFALICGPAGYLMCIGFAWLINELPKHLRAIVILLFYAPSISGATYIIWTIIFSGDNYGFLNAFLLSTGLANAPIQWLTDAQYIPTVVIIVSLWISLGPGFLSFAAGFKNVDKTLYEAGAVEGIKNRYQELWYITLPYIKPQMLFGAVMSVTSSLSIGAVVTGLCGFPSTDYSAYTIVHHIEDYGSVRFDMGYACATSTVLFLIMLLSNLGIQKIIKKVGA